MLQAEFACTKLYSILKDAMEPAVIAAASIVKEYVVTKNYKKNKKSGIGDFVTDVDIFSSRAISNILNSRYPEIEILDEENKHPQIYEIDKAFIVDPIDGTLNFIHGFPEFCISIGYVENGKPLIGAVYQPVTDTLFTGVVGMGAWKNNNSIYIGEEELLEECLIATGIPYRSDLRIKTFIDPVTRLMDKIQEIRCFGSAALALCYVASNQLSGFYEFDLSPWDIAGGAAIVLSAGGTVSTIKQNGNIVFGNSIIAANAKITKILCDFLIENENRRILC